jgi:hypothetical protein
MRKCANFPHAYMRRPLVIYDFAPDPSKFPYMRNFLISEYNKKVRMPSKHKMSREGRKQVGELAVIYADEGEGGCVHSVPVGRPSYPTPEYINGLTALTTALMYIDAYLYICLTHLP